MVTYKRRRYRNHLPPVPRLHYRRIQSLHRIPQLMEITADQLVIWKFLVQHVEELHEPRGYIFWLTQRSSPRQ
jgi:hypothetical protein